MSETLVMNVPNKDTPRSPDIPLQHVLAQEASSNASEEPASQQTFQALEKWNGPGNLSRIAATFLSFFVLGMNDASPGVCDSTLMIINTDDHKH